LLKRFIFLCRRLIAQAGGASEFLCDNCKYDYGSVCCRPERPNARRCPDYRSGK
jgi:predicted nucleic acid binding AN1-type Zn finger protein